MDANTVVSAALNPNGVPCLAIEAVRANSAITSSDVVYGEIAEVLARPKFARVLTDDRRHEILELLSAAALWIEPTGTVRDCRDSKDNCHLELALAADATAIVSWDHPTAILTTLGEGAPCAITAPTAPRCAASGPAGSAQASVRVRPERLPGSRRRPGKRGSLPG